MSDAYHVPVLREEVLAFLPAEPDGIYVDGTLGGGGHARALLERLGPRGLLLGVDRDREALEACWPLEAEYPGKVRLLHGNFGELGPLLRAQGWEAVDGVLVDLGVSSRHLDEAERGFSFVRGGPLDMRMDASQGVTAADLVNESSEEQLVKLFEEFGEEPRSRKAARAVVEARRRAPISTTADLARVLERALGRRGPKHPGTRIFQALRIAVNQELSALDALLVQAPVLLKPGGRLVTIAYHSLEDRRIKRAFRETEGLEALTRKAVKPTRAEVERNPRARSARLRAAQRIIERS
ncbi:MAG: 16S rRNA (cytosine(1402)-N(4))-methyltransferase RsmH [Deltaproteobacteria bacterium]|nr:16S rRNA (cytosine(1402)-N(4))-methyltransferase RsmH [Deltaproteobacteria bacterium]